MSISLLGLIGLFLVPCAIASLIFSCVWNIIYIVTFVTVSSVWVVLLGMFLTVIEIPLILNIIKTSNDVLVICIACGLLFFCSSLISCAINCINPNPHQPIRPISPFNVLGSLLQTQSNTKKLIQNVFGTKLYRVS